MLDSIRSSSSVCSAQILRLIDQEDSSAARSVFVDEEDLEDLVEFDRLLFLVVLSEGQEDPAQQVAGEAAGVVDQADGDAYIELVQQVADECGLAGADLACDDGETGLAEHAVLQDRIGHAVPLAEVQEARVREQGEWLFVQAIEGLVHGWLAWGARLGRAEARPRGVAAAALG